MNTKAQELDTVIREIRLSFNLLKAFAEELHSELNISASKRAVMENLRDGKEKTVPEIARIRGVSRQHIQVNADGLIEEGIIKSRDNPDDKRTLLISLTDRGLVIFGGIEKREQVELRRLSKTFSLDELTLTLKTLLKLNEITKGTENE